jgi:hypothetical protein
MTETEIVFVPEQKYQLAKRMLQVTTIKVREIAAKKQ